jgi:hypothetical protein
MDLPNNPKLLENSQLIWTSSLKLDEFNTFKYNLESLQNFKVHNIFCYTPNLCCSSVVRNVILPGSLDPMDHLVDDLV